MSDQDRRVAELEEEVRRLEARVTELSERDSTAGFLQSLLSVMPAFIGRLDDQLRILYLNQLAPGRTMDDVIGVSIMEFIALEHHAIARASLEGVLATGEPDSYEIVAESSPGQHHHYRIWVAPIRDAERVKELVYFAFDNTEQRQLEEQLRSAQRMEAVGNLTAGIAHNFNNLLTAILPSFELLRPVVPLSHHDLIDDAEHAGERAAELVRQLMGYSGQRRLTRPRVQPVRPILEAALSICRRTFDRHIVVESEIAPDLPPVSCDAGALEQVFMNVLVNARDAVLTGANDKPRIEVVARADGDAVEIEVSDNGPGVASEVQDRIFDPFFTTKGVASGTGLGLATSFAIVREHDGTIEHRESASDGAVFVISLPAISQPADTDPAPSPTPVPTAKRRVLLVDDERVVRSVVTRILEREGHHVVTAASRGEAIDLLTETANLDLVLLDRSMPDGPGDSLIPNVRDAAPDAQILFFTGQDVEDGARAVVDGIVQKPVDARGLLDAIAAAFQD